MTPTVIAAIAAADAPSWLFPAFGWTLRTGLEACAIAVLVIVAQWALGDRVSARWRYNLWLLVVARLILPSVPSRLSPFNALALNDAPPTAQTTSRTPTPSVPQEPLLRADLPPVQLVADAPLAHDAHGSIAALPNDSTTSAAPRAVPADLARTVEPAGPGPEPDPTDHGPGDAPPASSAVAVARVIGQPWPNVEQPEPEPSSPAVVRDTAVVPPAMPAPGATPASAHSRPLDAPENSPSSPWRLALASLWAAGVVVCLGRLALNAVRFARRLRLMPVLADADFLASLHAAAAVLGVRRLPEVRLAPDDCPPALVGAVRPRLLLSRAVLASLSPSALRLVLLHELEHLKRRDVLANWLLALLAAMHWFNPLLWLCFRRMRADRELACDEQVLFVSAADAAASGGVGRERYGQTIVNVLHVLSSRAGRSPAVTTVGVLDGKNFLRRRITMIARLERSTAGAPRRRVSVLGCAASALLAAVALTGAVRGQEAVRPLPGSTTPQGLPAAHGEAHDSAAAPSALPPTTAAAPATGQPGDAHEHADAPPALPRPTTGGLGPVTSSAPQAGAGPVGQPPVIPGLPSPGNGGDVAPSTDPGGHGVPGAGRATNESPDSADDRHADALLEADIQAAKAKLEAAKITADYKASEAARVREQVKAATVSTSEAERVIAEAAIAGTQIEVAMAELRRAEAALASAAQRRLNAERQARRLASRRGGDVNGGGSGGFGPGGFGASGGSGASGGFSAGGGFGAGGGIGGAGGAPNPWGGAPQAQAGVTTRVEDGTTRSADLRAWKQLGGPLSVQFDGVQLGDALDHLAEQAGVTVFVDWNRMEAAGVTRDNPVSVRLRDPMPADQVLELILRSGGGEAIGFTVDRGVVVIDTQEAIRRTMITRAYDVGELRRVEEDVATAVRESVRPDSWRTSGGQGGIRMFGDQLIVSADEPTHREIEKLLGLLRAGAAAAPAGGRPQKSDAGGGEEDGSAFRTQAAASALSRSSKDRWVFVPQTAAKAVEWISRESGVPIRLDVDALKSVGVDPAARIEFVMGASDPVSALKTVLTQATNDVAARSRSVDTLDVAALIVDGELRVSTFKGLEKYRDHPDAYWIIGAHSEQAASHEHGATPPPPPPLGH